MYPAWVINIKKSLMNYEKKQHIDLRLEWNSQKVGYDLFSYNLLLLRPNPKKYTR